MVNKLIQALSSWSKWLKFVIGATGSLKQNTRPRITAALHTNAKPSEADKEIGPEQPGCTQDNVLDARNPSTPTTPRCSTAPRIAVSFTQRKDVNVSDYQYHLEDSQPSSWTRRMGTAEFVDNQSTSTSSTQTVGVTALTTSSRFIPGARTRRTTSSQLTSNATGRRERSWITSTIRRVPISHTQSPAR